MNELRDRFQTLERLAVPDLTEEVTRRAQGPARPDSRPSRMAATIVALGIAAAAIAFLVVAFQRQGLRQQVGTAAGDLDAVVQGIRVRWPGSWTLVQLSGEAEDGRAWPILQLANFDPGLDAAALCPETMNLPADGVVLYLQRDLAPLAEDYGSWPVDVDPSVLSKGACGRASNAAWTIGETRFQASFAFGPEASQRDRDRLLEVIRSLEVVQPEATKFWHNLRPTFVNTWYVVWGVRSGDSQIASTFLVGDDPTPQGAGGARVLGLRAFGLSWGELETGQNYQGLGDGMTPDRPFAQSWGFVSAQTDRATLIADDGREYPLALGPALDRFGIAGRPTYVEFEPPLLGEFVAFDVEGRVLERERFENYPPESDVPPSPSPSPQAEEQVWLPDAEARHNREEIEAAIDGPVLIRGNNWNYPWVVYLSADGEVMYRDGDSVGQVIPPKPHLGGTRYSFPPDPEVLYVGLASAEVAWFGVEGDAGRTIVGEIIDVPGSDRQVVSVTAGDPQRGDHLVAKGADGEILQRARLVLDSAI